MPPTNAPATLPDAHRAPAEPTCEKNERPQSGANEQKFVIKLLIPIPA
jgi:hypothetical protein